MTPTTNTPQRRSKLMLSALAVLLITTGVAWKFGYFEPPVVELAQMGNDPTRPEPEPWELELQATLRDQESEIFAAIAPSNQLTFADVTFPQAERVHLLRDFNQRYLEFLRTDVTHYTRTTRDSAKAQEAVLAFLKKYLAYRAGLLDQDSVPEIRQLGQVAIEAGTQDALALFHIIDDEEKNWENAIRPAIDKLLACQPTLVSRLLATEAMLRHAKFHKNDSAPAVQRLIECFVEWIETSRSDDDQQQFIFSWVRKLWDNSAFASNRRTFYERCCRAKGANPWLVHMVSGLYHKWLGYKYRGEDLASRVDEENWKSFAAELDLASRHYSYAWKLQPTFSDSCEGMVAVLMSGDSQQFGTVHAWFQRGIDTLFDDIDLYDRYFWALEPRWGGSVEEILLLGDKCLETDRFDTKIPERALDALARIQWDTLGTRSRVMDRPDAQQLLTKYCERFWDAVEKSRNVGESGVKVRADNLNSRTLAAGLCFQAIRLTDARRFLEGFPTPNRRAPFHFGRVWEPGDFGVSAAFAAAEDEPLVKAVLKQVREEVDRPIAQEEYAKLIASLTERREQSQNPQTLRFCDHALAFLSRHQKFHAAEWVPLTFQNNAAGWNMRADKWECLDDQTVLLSNANTKDASVVQADSLNRFHLPYCVEFEVEHIRPDSTKQEGVFPTMLGTIGAVIGARDYAVMENPPIQTRHIGVDAKMNSLEVLASQLSTGGVGTMLDHPSPNQFRLKCWPGWYSIFVDGSRKLERPDSEFQPAPFLGFGSCYRYDTREKGNVKIRNIRIRKLPYGPPPVAQAGRLVEFVSDMEEYYRRVVVFDPDDQWGKFFLGQSLEMK